MMGKDERECVKLPFGEYLKVPDDNKKALTDFPWVLFACMLRDVGAAIGRPNSGSGRFY